MPFIILKSAKNVSGFFVCHDDQRSVEKEQKKTSTNTTQHNTVRNFVNVCLNFYNFYGEILRIIVGFVVIIVIVPVINNIDKPSKRKNKKKQF